MHASTEHLLGLGLWDNNQWGHEVESVISLTVSHNSLNLGLNTAADLWGFLQNNIDCLTNQVNVQCIPFRMCIMSIDLICICIGELTSVGGFLLN